MLVSVSSVDVLVIPEIRIPRFPKATTQPRQRSHGVLASMLTGIDLVLTLWTQPYRT